MLKYTSVILFVSVKPNDYEVNKQNISLVRIFYVIKAEFNWR